MEANHFAKKPLKWPFYIYHREDIIFVHIPKTAGTSIRHTLGFNSMDRSRNIHNHYTSKEIINLIGENRWKQAFKFSFVRNPWDRLYSFYCFRRLKGKITNTAHLNSFKSWAKFELLEQNHKSINRFNLKPQVDWLLNVQGKIELDFIGRFENIQSDFEKLKNLVSIEENLPHLNKSTTQKDYLQHYDNELIKLVSDYYQSDLNQFGYTY